MLYTLSKPASYVPNIFEGLKKVAGLDSVANFLYAYNVYKFDPSKSVAGDIVDGKTIYLDSVSTLNNEMLDNLGYLDAEDSTYWMLAPTNEVWNRLVPKYEKYFHFSNGVFSGDPHLRDSLTWTLCTSGPDYWLCVQPLAQLPQHGCLLPGFSLCHDGLQSSVS